MRTLSRILVGIVVVGAIGLTYAGTESFQRRGRLQPPTNPATERKDDPYWQKAMTETYKSVDELKAQAEREVRRGDVLAKLGRGNPKKKLIALTFDDGPHPDFTPQLLDILEREKVRATFFVIGKMVERYPDLIRQIRDHGHVLANHSFSHVTLSKIPGKDVPIEYQACNDIVFKVAGVKPKFCRPPGGDYDADVIHGAEAVGLTTVLWTDDPLDYASPGATVIEERTMRRLSNGGIILLHDGAKQTLQVLPQIIEIAKKKGFKFVGIDELEASMKK